MICPNCNVDMQKKGDNTVVPDENRTIHGHHPRDSPDVDYGWQCPECLMILVPGANYTFVNNDLLNWSDLMSKEIEPVEDDKIEKERCEWIESMLDL